MALRVLLNPPVKLPVVAFPLPSLCLSILFSSSSCCLPSPVVFLSLSINVTLLLDPKVHFFLTFKCFYIIIFFFLLSSFLESVSLPLSMLPPFALSLRVSFKPPVKLSVFSVSFQLSVLYLPPISILSLVNLLLCHTVPHSTFKFSSTGRIVLRVCFYPPA